MQEICKENQQVVKDMKGDLVNRQKDEKFDANFKPRNPNKVSFIFLEHFLFVWNLSRVVRKMKKTTDESTTY